MEENITRGHRYILDLWASDHICKIPSISEELIQRSEWK